MLFQRAVEPNQKIRNLRSQEYINDPYPPQQSETTSQAKGTFHAQNNSNKVVVMGGNFDKLVDSCLLACTWRNYSAVSQLFNFTP